MKVIKKELKTEVMRVDKSGLKEKEASEDSWKALALLQWRLTSEKEQT